VVASAGDAAQRHPDEAERARNQAFVDLMIPVVKGWSTEVGIEVASLGVQIHGGMGFIEETGAAQYLRDARITTIYEGTTGIQANDLIFRKLMRDGGMAGFVFGEIADVVKALRSSEHSELKAIGLRLAAGLEAWVRSTEHLAANVKRDVAAVLAAAVPYLHLAVTVCGGWQMGRAALAAAKRVAAGEGDSRFCAAKIATAHFYADHVLPLATAYHETVKTGGTSLAMAADDLF